MPRLAIVLLFVALLSPAAEQVNAGDWLRFRGPNGTGTSGDKEKISTSWGDSEDLKWKLSLPGPGSSSPIVVGNRVFVSCWSGYGVEGNSSDQEKLKRHLICVDRESGKQSWIRDVDPYLPEDRFSGMFTENGYASHTPVSDGKHVYAFFGKTGVIAFDLDGKKIWQKSVGTGSGAKNWGTASSPIIYKNLVIVPATAESKSLVALNKETGEQVWEAKANSFSSTWGSPVLVDCGDGRTDLVIAVPFEIWGLDPDTGKLRWYCEGVQTDSMCSSVVAAGGVVYAVEAGPRGGGAIAVRAGGKGDVSDTHTLWTTSDRSRIGTPVVHDGRIYWISSGIANCIDSITGKRVYQSRLSSSAAAGTSRPSGGRGRGGQDYSSPVVSGDRMVFANRGGTIHVVKLGESFESLGQNTFSDGGDFSSTPAISNGQLFIRSSKFLYCVDKEG